MNSKTKVTLSITAMVMVTLIAVVSIIAVFAARSQNFTSQVSVKYTATQITGKVTANYYVGPSDTAGTPMKNKSGGTELRFSPSDSLNDYLNPDAPIELSLADDATDTPDKSWVVFEYCFTNGLGQPVATDYMAKLNFSGTADNIKITTKESDTKLPTSEFSKILSRMAEPSNFGSQLVVVEHNEQEDYTSSKYFYVKAEIDNWGADSTFEGDFTWDLSLFKPTENLNLTMSGDHYVVAGSNGEITGDLIIPNENNGTPVTEIGANAFQNDTGITNIYIPNGITTIGANAFVGCSNVECIMIGEDVNNIGSYAFADMDSVTLFVYNAMNATLGYSGSGGVFRGLSNSSGAAIIIGDRVTTIPSEMFRGYGSSAWYPNLWSLTLGQSVQTIGDLAFTVSGLQGEIVFPESLINIGSNAFGMNDIEKIKISKNVKSIGEMAFFYCDKLIEISIESQDVCNHLVEWNTGLENSLQVSGTIKAKYEIQDLTNYTKSKSQNAEGYWVYTKVS